MMLVRMNEVDMRATRIVWPSINLFYTVKKIRDGGRCGADGEMHGWASYRGASLGR